MVICNLMMKGDYECVIIVGSTYLIFRVDFPPSQSSLRSFKALTIPRQFKTRFCLRSRKPFSAVQTPSIEGITYFLAGVFSYRGRVPVNVAVNKFNFLQRQFSGIKVVSTYPTND